MNCAVIMAIQQFAAIWQYGYIGAVLGRSAWAQDQR